MKLGRLSHIGIAVLSAALLSACSEPVAAPKKIDPEASTFAEILASDLRNPELCAALGERIKALRTSGASITAEMKEAGFLAQKAEPGCEALTYTGAERTRLAVDDTLRITWKDCDSGTEKATDMTVTFGASE